MNPTIKHMAKALIYYAPKPLKVRLKKKVEAKRLKDGMERYKKFKVSKEEIENVMEQIDFDHDIMLHTSTLNIGHIAGGVKFVTDAILSHIDLSRHTLVVSALPFFGSFSEYLDTNPVFDVRTAPIAMGAINERIAALPEAIRSVHPTHSVVAVGKDADTYISGHHLGNTPFGPYSPYHKLIKNRAKIILFGATMDNITLIHAVEDAIGEMHPVKDIYTPEVYALKCIDNKGDEIMVTTRCHNPRRAAFRRDIMLNDGLRKGYIKQWKVGDGYIREIDAYEYAANYIEKMKGGQNLYGRCKKLPSDFVFQF